MGGGRNFSTTFILGGLILILVREGGYTAGYLCLHKPVIQLLNRACDSCLAPFGLISHIK